MAKPLCIYHGNCADGFTAAWIVWKFFKGEVDFYAGSYSKPPPDVRYRDIIITDFSYKRPILEQMADLANSVLILDHHKTAAEDLRASGRFIKMFNATYGGFLGNVELDRVEGAETQIYTVFDMERSGAGITWDFFFPDQPRPKLVNHVEDRDLWRFAIPGTREIQACVFSYPYEFEVWQNLVDQCESPDGAVDMAMQGVAIERKHFKDIDELLEATTRPMRIGGYVVPAANLPYTMTSDAGHKLCQTSGTFACCYMDKPEGRYFSLRSDKEHVNAVDVSEIAKQYGGGGHANAAGFTMPYDQLAQFEVEP